MANEKNFLLAKIMINQLNIYLRSIYNIFIHILEVCSKKSDKMTVVGRKSKECLRPHEIVGMIFE